MGFHVIGADTLAAKQAVKNAGLDGVLVQAVWDQLQPNGAGSALATSAVSGLNQQITDARNLGLIVSFEYAPHYPPAWVKSSVEAYTDHTGTSYTSTSPGKDVRNWVWTALGRQYLADFYTKVYAGLTAENRAAIAFVKFGGGYYGEIQYPVEVGSAPFRYWGGGASMQTGTGLATGLVACPVPGYSPFSGTDAQDVQYINWYLSGIEDFVKWQIILLKSLGFTCPLYALHSGYSVRNNLTRASDGWRENFARGHDFTRMLGVYKNDPQVWPWSTWLGGYDGWTPNSVDSDQAAWKKLYAVAAARGKHHLIGGENTGGETNDAMDVIVTQSVTGSPTSGPIYADGRPRTSWSGYKQLMWLNYSNLVAGGTNATLERYGKLKQPYLVKPGNNVGYYPGSGPYSAWSGMWGTGIAGNESMTFTNDMRINQTTFPNDFQFNWNITPDPDHAGVNGYLHLDYGNYDDSAAQFKVTPRQISGIGRLKVNIGWTYAGDPSSGLLSETWLSNQSADHGPFTKTHEIAFFPRVSAHAQAYVASSAVVGSGSFTSGGVTWNVREDRDFTGAVPYIMAYRPGYVDFQGALPYDDYFAFLVAAGKIPVTAWVNGVAFGVEPDSGAASLTINQFNVEMLAGVGPTAPVAVERISNGTFDAAEANWAGFWYSGKDPQNGKANLVNTPAYDGIDQAVVLETGKYYDLTYTISGYVTGSLYGQLSGTDGATRTANGTYKERILAGTGNGRLHLMPRDTTTLSIDNVSLVGPYTSATPTV